MARGESLRLPRRQVLLAGVSVLGAVAVVPVLTGCADTPPDPLVTLLAQARADAVLAASAAEALRQGSTGGRPDSGRAELLAALSAARRAHADALSTELGDDAPPPEAERPVPATPDVRAVTTALDDSRRAAADAVPGLSRHRAALVGSIAACCAAYRAVLS